MLVTNTKFQRARMRDLMSFDENPPVKEKKTYTQQWHEYNLSQTSEKLMFLEILKELGYEKSLT